MILYRARAPQRNRPRLPVHPWILASVASIFGGVLVSAMPVSVSGATSRSPAFTIRNLGVLTGGFDSEALGIDASGRAVGFGSVTTGSGRHRSVTTHAFEYAGGRLIDLGSPAGASASYAHGLAGGGLVAGAAKVGVGETPFVARVKASAANWIKLPGPASNHETDLAQAVNDRGLVVGSMPRTGAVAWRVQGGAFRLVSLHAPPDSLAAGVDDSGDIVGYRTSGNLQAFLWPRMGKLLTLPALFGTMAQAVAVVSPSRNLILVAGTSHTRAGQEAAVLWRVVRSRRGWVPQRPQALPPVAGFKQSQAYGLNARGWVIGVGFNSPPRPSFTAALWLGGRSYDLNHLLTPSKGWTLTHASAVNAAGEIAGWGSHGGQERAYILSPRL